MKNQSIKITDLRVVNIDGLPKHCILLKIYTNQGIIGLGEVRERPCERGDPDGKSIRCVRDHDDHRRKQTADRSKNGRRSDRQYEQRGYRSGFAGFRRKG